MTNQCSGGSGLEADGVQSMPLRLLALTVLLLLTVGCQRAGVERPEAPGARGAPSVVGIGDAASTAGDRAARSLISDRDALPTVEVDPVDLDPILDSRVARDEHLQDRARFWEAFWTTRSRDHFERYLERMGQYHALVDAELEGRGLPASLRYLPIVESGYHHSIRSRVGATGLWQLMAPTARDLDLLVDGIVDDRRDPVASTRAALDYLTYLHGEFDSWFLALAAYNAGQGRVGRILDAHVPDRSLSGDEQYLHALPHLPAETREFVPRFLAAAALASDPEIHGLRPVDGSRALVYDEVLVPDATSLDVVARAAGVGEDDIVELNPHYLRGYTPPGQERVVRVPRGTSETFAVNYAQIPPDERVSFVEHQVASGETLSHIARRYGVSVGELQGANGNLDPRRLQIGQRLVVPLGGATAGAQVAANAAGAGRAGSGNGTVTHVVDSGESLWTISRRYGVGVAEIRDRNGLDEGAVLQPGQELDVEGAVRFYTVRSGDTWGGIAQRFGVSASALARTNGRSTNQIIRVGEELRVP